jgi:hypothetical protein
MTLKIALEQTTILPVEALAKAKELPPSTLESSLEQCQALPSKKIVARESYEENTDKSQ